MNIIRRKKDSELDLFHPFEDLERDFGRMLNSLWRDHSGGNIAHTNIPLDIEDKGDHYSVKADLPGFKKEDLKVEVDGDVVNVHAERNKETEEEKKGEYYYERQHGSFQRSFRLGTEVNEEDIKASLKNGVLSLTLPKKKVSAPKQIDVQAE